MPATQFKAGAPAPSPLPRRNEAEIMSTWRTHDGTPTVSICCVTFNHAEYLRDALNGMLGQVTSFPFEIIVRDDASTDGTTDILLDYAERYPNIIRPVIELENQHSKGIRANPALVPLIKGEFVAMCEGDDYWICPDKLEKQVSLLRTAPQATMCVARTVVCKEADGDLVCESLILGNKKDLQYFNDIKTAYFHTSTYLIRTGLYRTVLSTYANKIEFGDTALRYMLANIGPFVLLKEVVSVYRVTGCGIWSSLSKSKQLIWEIKVMEGFYKYFDPDHRRYFGTKLFYLYLDLLRQNIWTFNNRQPVANLARFIYLSAAYGIFSYAGRLLRRIGHVLSQFSN